MKTTIITLAYNHERYIREALSSVLAQSHLADEVIVVDDASPDGTAAAIEEFLREHPGKPIRFVRNERNLGVTGSCAKAIAMASGDILVMMAGDDVSAPGRVERCVAYFAAHPLAMALITNADIIDGESRPVGILDNCAGRSGPVALRLTEVPDGAYFLRGRSSCGATAAYRVEVFRSFEPLRSGLYAEDDPAAFRAMLLGTCDFLPERLAGWRRHAHNLSHGTGGRRGPEMAAHFRTCEAMMDQMLADAEGWVARHDSVTPDGLRNAMANLRFQKSKWALWAAAHEGGISAGAFLRALRSLHAHRTSALSGLREPWRPLFKMLTPFCLQGLMAGYRRRP